MQEGGFSVNMALRLLTSAATVTKDSIHLNALVTTVPSSDDAG